MGGLNFVKGLSADERRRLRRSISFKCPLNYQIPHILQAGRSPNI